MNQRQEEKLSEARERVTRLDTTVHGEGGVLDRVREMEEEIKLLNTRITSMEAASQISKLELIKGLLLISIASGGGAALIKPAFEAILNVLK